MVVVFCSTVSMFAMDTPLPAALRVSISVAVVDYDSLPCFINNRVQPSQIQLPGGIVTQGKSAVEAARDYLERQTGIGVTIEMLKLIAHVKRCDSEKHECLDQYYLIDNERLVPEVEEDSAEFHLTNRDIAQLVKKESYYPRDHTKPSVPVSNTLQKVAQHINDHCSANSVQEYLEDQNNPQSKCKLQLFAYEMKPEKQW